MRRKIVWLLALLMMFAGLAFGCKTLGDFTPMSTDEESIKAFFMLLQKNYDDKNIPGILSAYHNDASIMVDKERRIVSKEAYAEKLKSEMPSFRFGVPKIKIGQDDAKAEVNINMNLRYYNMSLAAKFYLVRSDGGWLITEMTYTY